MSHTPGPWIAHHRANVSFVAANTKIADVFSTVFKDEVNQHANANLMAAAPELLQACRDTVVFLEGLAACAPTLTILRNIQGIAADASAAIAKAEGKVG